jgi:hypothetical protein
MKKITVRQVETLKTTAALYNSHCPIIVVARV